MRAWAVVFVGLFLAVGCAKQTPLPIQDTTPYNLEYGALPAPDIEAFLNTLTDYELITDERYSSPF